MRRWLKVLLGVLAALVVLLILNAVVLDHQTKSAEVTMDGAKILSLPGGDLQVLDSGLVDSIFRAGDSRAPAQPQPEPIVLLHCYTCSTNWWDKLIPLLERAGRRGIGSTCSATAAPRCRATATRCRTRRSSSPRRSTAFMSRGR